jgi:hypothetical protein
VVWRQANGSQTDIYAKEFNGTAWTGLAGSDAAGGLSATPGDSIEPTAAYVDGKLYVAWTETKDGYGQIYAKVYDGTAWGEAGPGAAGTGGVSATSQRATSPHLAAAGGRLYLAWTDRNPVEQPGVQARLFVKTWNGTAFAEQLPGDASGGGISPTGGVVDGFFLTVDGSGRPTIAWSDRISGLPAIYLRTVTQQVNRTFTVAPGASIQAVLDANDFGAGDAVLLQSGTYAGFTLNSDDAGVLILGAPGQTSIISGRVTVSAGTGGTLQRLRLGAGLADNGSTGLTLVDSTVNGELTLAGGSGLQILHNRFSGSGTGIRLAAASQGLIAHNDIGNTATGIDLVFPFTGSITDNDIHGAAIGVNYTTGAALAANRIFGNTTGVRTTVSGSGALGFIGDTPLSGIVEGRLQNEIYGNATGVVLVNANVQAQWIHGNTTGVSGSGTVGERL